MLGGWGVALGADARRLMGFRDVHSGKTCFVIGNGPSVRREDLDALSGMLTVGANRLYLAYQSFSLRPTYLFSGDVRMVGDFGHEMLERAEAQVVFCLPARPALDGSFLWVRSAGGYPFRFGWNPLRGVSPGGSTLAMAIQVMHWMGVRKFVLYGVDHSFNFVPEPSAGRGLPGARGDGNHFIPNYRSGRVWVPPAKRLIEEAFAECDRVMRARGGWVKNGTRGGALEVLERVSFEDALESARVG